MNQSSYKKTISFYECIKEKSNVKGYWLDNNKKLFIDNIKIRAISLFELAKVKHQAFKNGEKSIFYIWENTAIIEYSNNSALTILRNRIIKKFSCITDKTILKYCQLFNGCTIHKIDKVYFLEDWTK